jgi:hypothetical protein
VSEQKKDVKPVNVFSEKDVSPVDVFSASRHGVLAGQ